MKKLLPAPSDKMLAHHNPLRGLSIAKVVAEMEAGQRGDYSNLQWLYHFIEKRDATLRGAKRRILTSVLKLDWDIKIQSDLSEADKTRADNQAEKLKAAYSNLKGFRATLRHLALAEFRGFSHVEKHFDANGEVFRLEPVPQWHWCRNGLYGDWLYQANALAGGINGVPINPGNFLIREIEDPINEIALPAHTRKGLSSKDFDAFIARYGIPFVFWILSDQMASALASDPGQMDEWMKIMRGIGSDGEGIIPGGTLETLDGGGGGKDNNPFLQHLGYQDEQIVMAATSGKLTMLNDATGLGSGNADAHQDTFDDIALALAMEISETLKEQFDAPFLARHFPNETPLCYFELAAKDAEDVGKFVGNVKSLDEAGWEIDNAELNEKTGYTLRRKAAPETAPEKTPKVSGFSKEPPNKKAPGETEDAGAGEDAAPADEAKQKNRDTPSVKTAAAALLAGFGKVATIFLENGETLEMGEIFADAVLTDSTDE